MFDPVDPRQSFPALEDGILTYWREEDMFKRSIRHRSVKRLDALDGIGGGTKEENFSFYDGPPFATGLPHYGHLLAGTVKDVIPRYQTMRGKRVERRFGWDCHGLPIENLIEKEHKIGTKKEIEAMGVAKFNALCRASVQRYAKEWRAVVERMGRWVDMDHDYRTMDPDYMESIWWVVKSLSDKKLLYEDYKSMHVCPRCETPLSNFEVMQGYKDIDDYSITARFKLKEPTRLRPPGRTTPRQAYMLAWTTTGWTLPGNMLLAVSKKVPYVTVESEGERYILAKARVEAVFKDRPFEIVEETTGSKLLGLTYEPLFPYFADEKNAFRVVDGSSFVTTEDGTGIVHIATGYGEDDYVLGKREGVPAVKHVGMDGKFSAAVTDFAGKDAKPEDDHMSGDTMIAGWLKKHGKLFKAESFHHSYPHCWRCDSPLINYATSSWFVAVEKIKKDMLAANAKTTWVPGHIRDGRFGRWLEGGRDWAISRNRYWGTPLPIWRCPETKAMEVIGSRDDLMRRNVIRFTKVTVLRHAESVGNVTPVYQGIVPGTKLTERGRKQAAETAKTLKAQEIARIYASPLSRTQETAMILGTATDAEVTVDDRLREVRFGAYEGKSVDFSDLTFVKARRAHKLQTGQVESIYHFPGMETWSEVATRTSEFLKEVLPRHRGEHIVIVTHADPLLTIKHFFHREDPAKLCHQPYPGFAEATTFYYDHATEAEMDLHKETVDTIAWPGSEDAATVHATFVRHGETSFNAEWKANGWTMEPLTEKGKNQAAETAKRLLKQKFDVLLCSDLPRARETADIIAKALKMKVTECPELRERNIGPWEGKSDKEILSKHPHVDPSFHTTSFHHETPDGKCESLSQFLERAQTAQKKLLAEFPGKRVLIVSHGGMIRAFRALTENLTYREAAGLMPNNAGIYPMPLHPLTKRTPEVLDCWFESGSMPYAQMNFPFNPTSRADSGNNPIPVNFPANFIAENLDQTRGWFYTLIVLSTALFDAPAFDHCICGGIILAEDGKKMSKRLKNYPDPMELMGTHGADALRFALMSSPVVRAETLRFSEKSVREATQNVLLPFWNTYSFFVTYANAANWEPTGSRKTSGHPLDQWIRAEVQDLTNRMTKQLDAYDLSATCAELGDTIDALTNWYVRLSRRRFAGKSGIHAVAGPSAEADQDRTAAIGTLYDVLLTLSQLLAPFCPMITEAVYLNLVPEDHGSIHLTDWPDVRKLTEKEESLIVKTRLLRTIASLGMKIRADAKLKTRQPLSKAVIAIPKSMKKGATLAPSEILLLQEELNVKTIELAEDVSALAKPIAMVDARKVGPRLGARVQEIIQAGKRGDFSIAEDGAVLIGDERMSPDEVTIVYKGNEGEGVLADRGVVLSLDTRVTPALAREGDVRDLIRAIQQLRKEQGYAITDHLIIGITGADALLKDFRELIEQETSVKIGNTKGTSSSVALSEGKAVLIFPSKP